MPIPRAIVVQDVARFFGRSRRGGESLFQGHQQPAGDIDTKPNRRSLGSLHVGLFANRLVTRRLSHEAGKRGRYSDQCKCSGGIAIMPSLGLTSIAPSANEAQLAVTPFRASGHRICYR